MATRSSKLHFMIRIQCRADEEAEHPYQLDFFTPGIKPRLAKPRKQMRQIPNFR